MAPEQLEVVWGISRTALEKSFGKIANKVGLDFILLESLL